MRDKLSLASESFRKKGLTLIELLIVCGIIVLLIGIIWSSFALIREKGRQVQCMNNLKQIWVALQSYRDDYDGVDPSGTPLEYWELGLPPCLSELRHSGYVKNWQVFLCPDEWRDILVSYHKGWWKDSDTWAMQRGIRFRDWIAKVGANLEVIIDHTHDRNYRFQILPPDDRYFSIWVTLDGTVKAGWYDVPGVPPWLRE